MTRRIAKLEEGSQNVTRTQRTKFAKPLHVVFSSLPVQLKSQFSIVGRYVIGVQPAADVGNESVKPWLLDGAVCLARPNVLRAGNQGMQRFDDERRA